MDCKMRLRTGDLHASQQEQIASLEAGVQAESALRENELRFRQAMHIGKCFPFDWNPVTDEVLRAPECADILGLSGEDSVHDTGQRYFQRIVLEDRDRLVTTIQQLSPDIATYVASYRMIRGDGSIVYLEETAKGFFDGNGKLIRLLGIAVDVTERRRAEEALRRSEQRLALATSGTRIGMFDWNIATGESLWNEQYARLLGYTATATTTTLSLPYQYKDWAERVHPDDLPLAEAEVRRCMAENIPYEAEYRVVWPDGSVHWVVCRGVFHYDEQDTPQRMLGTVMDITDRKRSEEALQRSESEACSRAAELAAIMEIVPAITFVAHDSHCRQVTSSRSTRGLLRVPEGVSVSTSAPEPERPRSFRVVSDGREVPPEELPLQIAAAKGIEVRNRECTLVFDDGSSRCIFGNATPLFDESGTSRGAVGAFLDITERKQLEEWASLLAEVTSQLLSSKHPQRIVESLCRTIMAHFDCQVFVNYLVDEQAGRLRLNACTGIPEEKLKEIEWLDFGTAVCGCVARDGCRIVAEDIQTIPDARAELVRSFGIQAYACHPLMDQGQVIGTLSFGSRTKAVFSERDIARMKAVSDHVAMAMQRVRFVETLEQRVAERTAESQWRANQLQQLAAQMTQAEERERRRLSQVLHDHLQQMLVAAKIRLGGVSRRVQDEKATAGIAEATSLIEEAIAESRSLTKELSPPVLYDNGLAAGLEWLGRETEKKYSLSVTVQVEPGIEPDDLTTKVFVFQAARELILNVVKHAHASHLQIGLSRPDSDRLQVTVRDDGMGFDTKMIDQKQTKGGFGLFAIRERLQVIGGQFTVASSPMEGTTATILAPYTRLPAKPLGPVVQQLLPPDAASTRTNRICVLLADDHPMLRKGIADMLREYPDLNLLGEASNGQEALDMALQLKPDVVLMDVTMPVMDGIEATRRIKEAAPGICVIALSMHESEDMAAKMRDAGASEYLVKTAAAEELISVILKQCPRA